MGTKLRDMMEQLGHLSSDIFNKTLRVVTVERAPFTMKRIGDNNETEYYGFCVDMVTELSRYLGFDYEMYDVRGFGVKKKSGNWTGQIREILNENADFSVAPLSVSPDRQMVVDFTTPFMHSGVGMVTKAPELNQMGYFGFVKPFRTEVWLAIMVAFFVISAAISLVSRWRLRSKVGDPVNDNDDKFTLQNSFWLALWSVMRKGGEPAPRSPPVRILVAFWWFFALIVITTYTANLTASLTVNRMSSSINSLEDLAAQTDIPYGLVRGGGYYKFFQSRATEPEGIIGSGTVFERMWYAMISIREHGVRNYVEGMGRARNGSYVYMADDTTLAYDVITDPECKLMMVGVPFLHRGYGIPTKKGSPLAEALTLGILKMQETGTLDLLKTKWWPKNGCPLFGPDPEVKRGDIGLDVFAGVFMVLGAGILLAIIVAACEIIVTGTSTKKESSTDSYDCNDEELENGYKPETITAQAEPLSQELLRCIQTGRVKVTVCPTMTS
ncbi:glutamate receptor ionotropic, kainate 2-like isoform X1 [Branchiostoma lanceolatum]|uniref:glutamate receptor ionotropic, kainate 2-like isoform X1 n=1 Tax=Branchiostoma lanceolatum TaxID=7740 RepID=UPI003451E78B